MDKIINNDPNNNPIFSSSNREAHNSNNKCNKEDFNNKETKIKCIIKIKIRIKISRIFIINRNNIKINKEEILEAIKTIINKNK